MMRADRWFLILCATTGLLLAPLAGQSEVETLVERAVTYVGFFTSHFANVVAEEHYTQSSGAGATGIGVGVSQRRDLKADFLLVKLEQLGGWMAFRDVFEVNGSRLRDREDRLTRLFVESPATAVNQAQSISQESARYNIGLQRTVNNPLLALAFLQDQYRSHFQFSLGGKDKVDGAEFTILQYKEQTRPTLIRGSGNRDLAAHGRYWVDPLSGNIAKSEIQFEQATERSRITTIYGFDERFGMPVPLKMEEEYLVTSGRRVTATATYDRFRRFEVNTVEELKK